MSSIYDQRECQCSNDGRVFFTQVAYKALYDEVSRPVIMIQKHVRGMLARNKFQKLKRLKWEKEHAAELAEQRRLEEEQRKIEEEKERQRLRAEKIRLEKEEAERKRIEAEKEKERKRIEAQKERERNEQEKREVNLFD